MNKKQLASFKEEYTKVYVQMTEFEAECEKQKELVEKLTKENDDNLAKLAQVEQELVTVKEEKAKLEEELSRFRLYSYEANEH